MRTKIAAMLIAFLALSAGAETARAESDEAAGEPVDEESCPPRPEDPAEARQLAGEQFMAAEQLYKDDQPDKALEGFVCSLRLAEHENTLFNIAHVTLLVKNMEAALVLLKQYVADHPDNETTPEIKKIIGEAEKTMGVEPTYPEPAPAEPEPEQPVEEVVEEPAPEELVDEEPAGDDDRMRAMKIGGWVGVGTGGASLLTGLILGLVAGSAKSDALDASSTADFDDGNDKYTSTGNGAIACLVIGGVLGGAGVTLLVLANRGESEGGSGASGALEVSLGAGPGGLLLKGEF